MATTSSANRRPTPGDVLAYGFLWSHESDSGRDEPTKTRPCVVVLAVGEGEHPQVMVAPVTSRDPGRADAIGLGPGALGLDRRSWVIPWELNVFQWLGPDIGPAPRPFGAWWRMGALSPELRRQLRERVEAMLKARRTRVTRLTE
jgi:hypothetical protein